MKVFMHVFAMVILAGLLTGIAHGQEEQPIDPLNSPPPVPVLGDPIPDGNGESPVSEAPPEPGPEFVIDPTEEPTGVIDPLISPISPSPVIDIGDSPTITPEPTSAPVPATAEQTMVAPVSTAMPEPAQLTESWRENLLWQAWLSIFLGGK